MSIEIYVQDEEATVKSDGVIIKGDSAYEVAVKNGYKGTEKEWLATFGGIAKTETWVFERKDGTVFEKTVILHV